jgi:hypothetical protein
MSVKTKISDMSLKELWIHMNEYICLHLQEIYLHPLYNIDTGKRISYFYNRTEEKEIAPDGGYRLLRHGKSRSVVFILSRNILGAYIYNMNSNRMLCIFQKGFQPDVVMRYFNFPIKIDIVRISLDESITQIPPNLLLFAKFIDSLEKGIKNEQLNVIDAMSILNRIFMDSLNLLKIYKVTR